jgi:heme/copper-type cytochrome/quinol oxidase subunit 3
VSTFAGILLLIFGVIFPMAMLFQINSMLSRKPAPPPSRVGMLLALNGVLPVALIISGLMLLSARFSAAPALRAAMIATWVASLALLIILAIGKGADRRKRGDDGG